MYKRSDKIIIVPTHSKKVINVNVCFHTMDLTSARYHGLLHETDPTSPQL